MDNEPLSRQLDIFIPMRVGAVLDVALTGLANSMGICQSERVQKFIDECKDSLGEVADGFGADDTSVNEAKDARSKDFQHYTELYGRKIFIIDANVDKDHPTKRQVEGVLKEITGPHTYIITVDGEDQHWEVDSVNDLEVPDDPSLPLNLWNAWN
jgi:hypothetical protein